MIYFLENEEEKNPSRNSGIIKFLPFCHSGGFNRFVCQEFITWAGTGSCVVLIMLPFHP